MTNHGLAVGCGAITVTSRHVPRSYRIGVGTEKTRETRESVGLPDRWLTILGFSARTIWITGHPVEEILKNQKILKVTTRAELIIHNTYAVTGTISFFCCGSKLRLLRTELTVCFSKNCSSVWCEAGITQSNQMSNTVFLRKFWRLFFWYWTEIVLSVFKVRFIW